MKLGTEKSNCALGIRKPQYNWGLENSNVHWESQTLNKTGYPISIGNVPNAKPSIKMGIGNIQISTGNVPNAKPSMKIGIGNIQISTGNVPNAKPSIKLGSGNPTPFGALKL